MNDERRKQILTAINELESIKSKLEDAKSVLESVKDDEQAAFDNLPEGLQASSKGEAMEEAMQHLESAIDELNNID